MKLPHLTFYTSNIQAGFAGTVQAFVVKIKPEHKADKGLHAHEYTHVKQWYRWLLLWVLAIGLALLGEALPLDFAPVIIAGVGIHGILYKFIPSYRLEAEGEAYAAQVLEGADLDKMAWFLAHKYDLDITEHEAKQEILAWL